MAITIAGCDRILQAAFAAKRKLYLGHNMRHYRTIQIMKQLIDQGAIGEVKAGWCRHFVSYGGDAYFKDWHADRTKSTGLLLQKGAHDIDLLHWLCKGYTRRVCGMGGLTLYHQITDRHDPSERGDATFRPENWPPLSQKGLNPVLDVEDLSMMLMELDNGVFCSYQQCHYTPDGWRNYTIIGTAGRIENFGDGHERSKVVLWNNRYQYDPEGDAVFRTPTEFGSHAARTRRSWPSCAIREGGKVIPPPSPRCGGAGYLAAMSCATESVDGECRGGGKLLDYFQPTSPSRCRTWTGSEVRWGICTQGVRRGGGVSGVLPAARDTGATRIAPAVRAGWAEGPRAVRARGAEARRGGGAAAALGHARMVGGGLPARPGGG
jgi:hypothetical protein